MDAGDIGIECFAARLWDQQQTMGLDLEELSYRTSFLPMHCLRTTLTSSISVAGTTFEAGTDTTSNTIHWFLLAMILYPEVMKKAQAELDAVLGPGGDMIPCFANFNDLPYCVALTMELFRWSPAAPGFV